MALKAVIFVGNTVMLINYGVVTDDRGEGVRSAAMFGCR